ncbi:MAG: hypothetical protein PHO20_06115 [Candidatus Peribacteraceae bacterium]|nr:hypothetical protein [Candidatus Peribacteraceae bacterium]
MTDEEITPKVLLLHMQGMQHALVQKMQDMHATLERRMDGLDEKFTVLAYRMDRVEGDIALMKVQVGNIGDTVDRMEIILIGQKHEERICELERRCSVHA